MFYLSGTARPGSPGKGPLNGCVCVCVLILLAYMLVSNTVDSGTGRAYVLQFSSRREPVDYKDCVMTDPQAGGVSYATPPPDK